MVQPFGVAFGEAGKQRFGNLLRWGGVQGKDAAYRKAYSLMILQEAERSLQKRAALTTCFADGKKALQERLVEILNGEKRKRGMALAAMTLVLALTCGCFVSYGGSDTSAEVLAENAALTAEQQEITRLWAEALSLRDGKIRYDKMGEKAKAQFEEEQKAVQGEDWNFNIGWSSPWVISYEAEEKENAAIITYIMQDSEPRQYILKELLKFGEENGKTVVESYLTSNLYWEDGKVHPVIGRRGMELDEGIWDFLYQSVVGFFSQSSWQIYELEEFNFNIINVEQKRLANGRDEIRVDFGLNIVDRNPFRDPDEAAYIQKAKEKNQESYEVLYKEYYEQKESNIFLRFTCEVLHGEGHIYEDTCYPDTFRLYLDDGNPHEITFADKNIASQAYYEEEPADGWFAYISPAKGEDAVTVERKLRISDTTGRTNNGYFDLHLEQGGVFAVAEDAVILLGEAGEEPYTKTKAEWQKMLADGFAAAGYTLAFEKDEKGNDIITEIREGYWIAEESTVSAAASGSAIPSGYPTESRTVSAPFSMADSKIQHFGMDFSSNGKNIPVSATADGIVMAAEFAPDKGYYVKINHMNGFATLYAHLSELDVKVGDKVEKGDVLGLTGATGMATGIHCHYEIQLNGIYQDPAKYL
ncbi:peptidoglycan DD-metalloendopeptidase family protein [Anaerotignum sp.]